MRKNLSLAVIALLASATLCIAQTGSRSESKVKGTSGSSIDQMIIDKSRENWEAYKSRNVAAIKALVAENFVAYTLMGPSNLQQDIANLEKLTIESYTIDEPKVLMAAKDVAILHYKCDLKGSGDGKPLKPAYVTEVWANRGGKWQQLTYTETPMN